MNKSKLTSEQALQKIQRYCAYQERSHKEVSDKLYSYGLWEEQVENILFSLIQDDFLNEERFAEAYTSGKFKFKHWGKIKIKYKLKEKWVSDYCINKALNTIEYDDYIEVIISVINKKTADYRSKYSGNQLKAKLLQFLQSRGFEYDAIKDAFDRMK